MDHLVHFYFAKNLLTPNPLNYIIKAENKWEVIENE